MGFEILIFREKKFMEGEQMELQTVSMADGWQTRSVLDTHKPGGFYPTADAARVYATTLLSQECEEYLDD